MSSTEQQRTRKPKAPGEALTIEEVADQLGTSYSSARRMIVEGQIASFCVRAGRRKRSFRVRPEVLQRWIAAQERQSLKKRFDVEDDTETTKPAA